MNRCRLRSRTDLAVVILLVGCGGIGNPTEPGSDAAGRGGTAASGSSGMLASAAGALPGGAFSGGASVGGASGGLFGGGDLGAAGVAHGGDGGASTVGAAGAGTGAYGGAAGAPTSAAGGTAGSGISCSGLVCEDFESGSIDPDKWELVAKGGTLTVQGQRVAHGSFAAQVHGQAGSSDDWALLVAKNAPAALKSTGTYGRVLMYAAADALASIHVQLAFAGRNGSGTNQGPAPFSRLRYMEVGSYGGRWQLGFDLLDVSPTVEETSYSAGRIPSAVWSCLEWRFEDRPDRVTTWLDGVQVSTFDNTNVAYASPGPLPKAGAALWNGTSSELIGGFETFGFGFHDWHPQRAFDIFYDDLVLDSQRVGCPAKP